MNATAALPVVGVDLAKSVFQLAVADASWRVIERHRLTRTQFERWFANRAVGLVVMEACGSAHHWARWLNALGIEVRLLPAAYVRAYVKRNKTDAADACALLEAARCADISPVRIKSVEQQGLQALHRTRSLWMGTRTSRINALRGDTPSVSAQALHELRQLLSASRAPRPEVVLEAQHRSLSREGGADASRCEVTGGEPTQAVPPDDRVSELGPHAARDPRANCTPAFTSAARALGEQAPGQATNQRGAR